MVWPGRTLTQVLNWPLCAETWVDPAAHQRKPALALVGPSSERGRVVIFLRIAMWDKLYLTSRSGSFAKSPQLSNFCFLRLSNIALYNFCLQEGSKCSLKACWIDEYASVVLPRSRVRATFISQSVALGFRLSSLLRSTYSGQRCFQNGWSALQNSHAIEFLW